MLKVLIYSFCFPLAKGFKETCLKMFMEIQGGD